MIKIGICIQNQNHVIISVTNEESVWILAGGVWNDSGVWDDSAVWID